MAVVEMVAARCVAACMKQGNSLRMWLKVGSFAVGLGLLLYGAWYLDFPDWDLGISLVMAGTTLATAEWSVSVLWQRRWRCRLSGPGCRLMVSIGSTGPSSGRRS